MQHPLNGNFWRVVAGFEAMVIGTLFVYGILRIHAIEVQAATQIQRNNYFEEKLEDMNFTLDEIKRSQDAMLMTVATPHLVARP